MKHLSFFLFTYLILASLTLRAQQDPGRWQVEDIIFSETVREARFAPDGQALVWSKRRAHKEKDKFINDIYLTRLDLRKDNLPRTFRLTTADENDHSPVFAPDGENIYFLSSRKKGKSLWKMSIYGGEPQEVSRFDNGISKLAWLNDHTLTYLSHDGKTLYETKNEKDNTEVIDDSVHWHITRVYAYDLKEKTSTRLTDNSHPVSDYAVSPDGRYLVVRLTMSPHYGVDGQPKPQVYLYDLHSKKRQQLLQGFQEPGSFRFPANNAGFYFTAVTSSDPQWNGAGITELYYYEIATQQVKKVPLNWDMGLGGGYRLSGNDVVASLANKTTRRLAFYRKTASGWQQETLDFGQLNDHLNLLAIDKSGKTLAASYSTASRLPEYRIFTLQPGRKKGVQVNDRGEFVRLNKKLHKRHITRAEVITWQGANNETVDGILYYPEDYQPGKRYPLVLSIHGGPAGSDMDMWSERWSTYPQLFAQRGAFVLKPNYHGSGNHGLAFVESIKGHYYDLEEVDILNALDTLAEAGLIDKEKLGVMGWSNGAILTTMLILRHPDMFKAAAAGAGDVNWTSDYGTCAFGVTFDQSYFGGAPWDDTDGKPYNETYILKSPLFEIEKIKTPTIIFHGSEDRAVPRDQGWEYYRGLQQVGKAPVRFLWFPGQPHGLQKITHQKRKMNEELRWFDTYLFNTYEAENEAFKEDSPLGNLLKLEAAAKQHNGRFGVEQNGHLLPQMISLGTDTISIGLFEVTNAQFQSLITGYTYPQGQDNYPATGLSREEIAAYLEKLSQLTGATYRLPNAREAKGLQKLVLKHAKHGNTLNYWAGYDPTPADAVRLRRKLNDLERSLLMPVGSFKPGKIKGRNVFDLGGNAAEYYLDGNTLGTYDLSAYDAIDVHSPTISADPAHTGFRVVRE